MHNVAIIALEYLEPEYQQTLECLKKVPVNIWKAERDGVGNLSKAFNRAFNEMTTRSVNTPKYVWFITNITFQPEDLRRLVEAMDETGYAAIHPVHNSDHSFLRWDGTAQVKQVPFVEFTAPIFRVDAMPGELLDEDMPYWYMDLDISHRLKQKGGKLGCHHGVQIGHTYLRNNKQHTLSRIRDQLRWYWKDHSAAKMDQKWGPGWQQKLWKEAQL